jgi:hypothetical protein
VHPGLSLSHRIVVPKSAYYPLALSCVIEYNTRRGTEVALISILLFCASRWGYILYLAGLRCQQKLMI